MAARRAIGRGLLAAGASIGDFLLRQQQEEAMRERQRLDDERAAKQAEATAEATSRRSLETEHYKENPVGLAKHLGIGIENEDAAAPIVESIGSAKNLSDLPTLADAIGRLKSRGGQPMAPIEPGSDGFSPEMKAMMDQRLQKEAALKTQRPVTGVDETLPDGSTQKTYKPTDELSGQSFVTGLSAQQQGVNEGAKELAGTPDKIKATNALNKGTFDEKFREEQKLASMKAAIELQTWAKKNATSAGPAAMASAKAATAGVIQMEEIIALATEINKGNMIGVADIYSGARNAVGQLPYVGPAIGGIMDTANATSTAIKAGDPTLIAKTNQLQAMRRAAAISVIRAAGDPRPSNADVDGVINSIPGAGDSNFATAIKAQTMRDTLTMVPEILKAHPELAGDAEKETGRGLMVIQLAMQEAKKRATQRSQSGRDPELGNPPANRVPLTSLPGASPAPAVTPPAPPAPKRLKLGPDGQWR